MQTVLITIHLIIILALIGVVLLQRSEGGGLGIGGGSGFMSARGAANALTKTTTILAIFFFITSLLLSIVAKHADKPSDILDLVPQNAQTTGKPTGKSILDQLGGASTKTQNTVTVPQAEKPKPTAPVEPKVPTN
jgi:preprotein translocase subunit SecG